MATGVATATGAGDAVQTSVTGPELARYVDSLAAAMRMWSEGPLARQDVLHMLALLGLGEDDAETVLEEGLTRGALRQDEAGIRAVEKADCWHLDLERLR